MTNEDLFRMMRDYRVAKVTFYPDGRIRTAIALPPEQEGLAKEDLDPRKIREEAERVMFLASEG